MYTFDPSLKMKFDVHWPPAVNVWTPGRIAAVAAGAHADAAGTNTSVASTETPATHSLSLFMYDPPAGRFRESPGLPSLPPASPLTPRLPSLDPASYSGWKDVTDSS